jgi:hypothetical protein
MDGAPPSTMNAANDYATSAAKELTIREQTAGLVSALLGLSPKVDVYADHAVRSKPPKTSRPSYVTFRSCGSSVDSTRSRTRRMRIHRGRKQRTLQA